MSHDKLNACKCADVNQSVLARYEPNLGMNIILVDAAVKRECVVCGAESIIIHDLNGLIAAVALTRVKIPMKLRGHEIRFIRKALEFTSKELCDLLSVTSETISRWENDKIPIGPASEKLLRLIAGHLLKDRAPLITFDPQEIIEMDIEAVTRPNARVIMEFRRVTSLTDKKLQDFYTEVQAA